MAGPVLDLDHAGEALDLLLEQFKDKSKIEELLNSFSAQIQLVENAYWQLLTERTLANATGTTLDHIGEILNRQRGSETDSEYRARLQIQVLIYQSSGTAEDILAVFVMVAGAVSIQITEGTEADFYIEINDPVTEIIGARAAAYLKELKAAGVGGLTYWHSSATPFGFDGDPDALGFGDGEFANAF